MIWGFVLTWIHIAIGLLFLLLVRAWGKKVLKSFWAIFVDVAAEVLRREQEKRRQSAPSPVATEENGIR